MSQEVHKYIHGTAPDEQNRLAGLNRLTNKKFIRFLAPMPNTKILEVGSGLGILAKEVADSLPGIHVTGVEISEEQIRKSPSASNVYFVKGDAQSLDFQNDTFDLVYARYLLEHVTNPEQTVKEMKRVAKPGGRIAACENDISLIRFDPECPFFDKVWKAFGRYQKALSGHPFVGRQLYRIFSAAGLQEIALSVQPEVHWYGSPGFESWVRNIIGNIESAKEGMIQEKYCTLDDYQIAVSELENLISTSDASALFVWNRAMGRVPF